MMNWKQMKHHLLMLLVIRDLVISGQIQMGTLSIVEVVQQKKGYARKEKVFENDIAFAIKLY